MKRYVFTPYQPDATDEFGRELAPVRAFMIAFLAIANSSAGNVEQTSTLNKLYKRFGALSVKTDQGRRLTYEGGVIAMEGDEYKVFRAALDEFRKNVMGASADALEWLDTTVEDYIPPAAA